MSVISDLRAALQDSASVTEAAKLAKELAGDASNAALLPELVAMLADALIEPTTGNAHRPRKGAIGDAVLSKETETQLVNDRTRENVALSEYARLINARDLLDGRELKYPAYAFDMDTPAAKEHLKKWRQPIKASRKGYESRYGRLIADRYRITVDRFAQLKREKLPKSDSNKK